jgi:hypothetical protein
MGTILRLSHKISISKGLGIGGKKIVPLWGNKNLSYLLIWNVDQTGFFLDLCSGRPWIKNLNIGYQPSNELKHKAKWEHTDTLQAVFNSRHLRSCYRHQRCCIWQTDSQCHH